VQPSPSAADLLAVVAEVLADDVVPALQGSTQHHARVAASLVAIVERELRLGPLTAAAERQALIGLLPAGAGTAGVATAELRERAAAALRTGLADDPAAEPEVWEALMGMVRAELAIAKPGHDEWEGD
jgi:hypothetical protein